MLVIILPKPAGSLLRISAAGIPTMRPKMMAAANRPTEGVTLSLMSAMSRSTKTIKNAINGDMIISLSVVDFVR